MPATSSQWAPAWENVKVGDRVTMSHYWQWLDGDWHASMSEKDYSATLDGFLAEQVVVPAAALIRLPDSLSYEEASTCKAPDSPPGTPWSRRARPGPAIPC